MTPNPRTLLILPILLLAGCTEPGPARDPQPTQPPPCADATGCPPATQAAPVELGACTRHGIMVHPTRDAISQRLPQGYTPIGPAPGLGTFAIGAFACPNAQTGPNTTGPVHLLTVTANVQVNESLRGDRTVHQYLFEIYVDNETIQQALKTAHPSASLAQITITTTPLAQIRVRVGQTDAITITSHPTDRLDPATLSQRFRFHHATANATTWLDADTRYTINQQVPAAATADVPGSMAKHFADPAGRLTGIFGGDTHPNLRLLPGRL